MRFFRQRQSEIFLHLLQSRGRRCLGHPHWSPLDMQSDAEKTCWDWGWGLVPKRLEEPRDNAQFHWLGYAKTAFGFRMWLQAHTAWEVSGAVNLKMKLKMTQKFREKPADSLQIYAKKMYNLTTILKFLQLGQCGYLGSESLTLHLIQRCFLIIDTWIIDTIWVSDIYQILR